MESSEIASRQTITVFKRQLGLAFAIVVITFFLPLAGSAQSAFKAFENLFTIPKNYIVAYTKTPPVIDGDINDAAWQQAQWTADFEDIEGTLKPKPPLQTNVKMLWDDSCLYIAAKIVDPNVWAYLTHHDDIVFRDNDFEVFINPNNTTHQYFELEFNAVNTVFDLFLNKPYRNLGNPMINWNAEGLHSAVKVQGSLNNPADIDKGWTIEIAIPFKAISLGNEVNVPLEGTVWRINFSRVEWDTKAISGKYVKLTDAKGRNLPEHNWVWSAQGVVDMHLPERWGYLQFSKSNYIGTFTLPYREQQKRYLWLVYYYQKRWRGQHHTYSPLLSEFGLGSKILVHNHVNSLQIEATRHQFMALITDEADKVTLTINQDGLVRQLNTATDE